jgi:hypothetical protein
MCIRLSLLRFELVDRYSRKFGMKIKPLETATSNS